MTSERFEQQVIAALDRWQHAGRIACFWLRDDDAIEPTPALDRLLALTARHDVPVALAVIPEPTGPALARRLSSAPLACVTVHGFAHRNHAKAPEKKSELGADRPAVVLDELAAGLAKLSSLYGDRLLPVLVPPWNRIASSLVPQLGPLGYTAISVYGPEKDVRFPVVNTHVDVMDWHGNRGCRDWGDLGREIVERLDACLADERGAVGILTHHLVHDEAVWRFMDSLFAATRGHPACRWARLSELLDPDDQRSIT